MNGDYGTLYCYPYVFSEVMYFQEGTTILLAALPHTGYRFSNWYVFKEENNGLMSLFSQSESDVLILNVDNTYSVDAIFIPEEATDDQLLP